MLLSADVAMFPPPPPSLVFEVAPRPPAPTEELLEEAGGDVSPSGFAFGGAVPVPVDARAGVSWTDLTAPTAESTASFGPASNWVPNEYFGFAGFGIPSARARRLAAIHYDMAANVEFFAMDEAGNSQMSAPYQPSDLVNLSYAAEGADPGFSPDPGGVLPIPPEPLEPLPSGPPAPPPTPAELATYAKALWEPYYRYDGGFLDGDTTDSLRIPVGPSTRSLTIAVRGSGREGALPPPRVDEMFLAGPRGEILATMPGAALVIDGAQQKIFLTIHGAVLGSTIVIRFVRTDVPASLDPGEGGDDGAGDDGAGGSWPGGDGTVPSWQDATYTVDVSRGDASPKISLYPTGSSASEWAETVVLPMVVNEPAAVSKSWTSDDSSSRASEAPGVARVADAPRSKNDAGERDVEEKPPEVFLGPLVSRTGAPMGPLLATSSDESTPSTNRNEHAAMNAMGADVDLDVLLERKHRAERDGGDLAGAESGTEPDAVTSTILGPGGVPIVVAALGATDARNEAEALAANLQRQARENALLANLPDEASTLDGAPRRSEIARAGLATRAVGFLIGMGLATGPLYPDLVAFARKKFHRKPRNARRRKPARRS